MLSLGFAAAPDRKPPGRAPWRDEALRRARSRAQACSGRIMPLKELFDTWACQGSVAGFLQAKEVSHEDIVIVCSPGGQTVP
jgi:hypothetical protein